MNSSENMHRKPVVSLMLSGLCQLLGFGAGVFTENYLELNSGPLAAHCIVAWLTSCFLKLKLPWQLFNVLIPLAVGALALGEIPNEIFALATLLLIATFLPTLWTKVPYYPTNNKVYDEILAKLPTDRAFTFIDLGSGFGWMLFYLANKNPHGRYYGVEIGPLPYLLSKLLSVFIGRSRVKIGFKNFWHLDLSRYEVVYAFLAPDPMKALWKKVKKEMRPGATFITNTFEVEEDASSVDVIEADRTYRLYTFQM